jgi:predicted HAD superfamily Cof-like phosphohydrolase
MTHFFQQVREFQTTFGLPKPTEAAIESRQRIRRFKEILYEEMQEADAILDIADLADWLGDIIVYCTSEAYRHGIPIEKVLSIIMDSNMSKLGPDGRAIIINGKVQKGPGYWKPEPKIRELFITGETK